MNDKLKEELFKERDESGIIPSIIGIILSYFIMCPIVYKIYIEQLITTEKNEYWAMFFIWLLCLPLLIGIFKCSFYFNKKAIRKYNLCDNSNKPFRKFLNVLNVISLTVSKIIIGVIIVSLLILIIC